MKKRKIYIFDNGGETIDRYTIIFPDYEMWGADENPYFPLGFGQYCGKFTCGRVNLRANTKHLGKPIKLEELSEKTQKFVREIWRGYVADGIMSPHILTS